MSDNTIHFDILGMAYPRDKTGATQGVIGKLVDGDREVMLVVSTMNGQTGSNLTTMQNNYLNGAFTTVSKTGTEDFELIAHNYRETQKAHPTSVFIEESDTQEIILNKIFAAVTSTTNDVETLETDALSIACENHIAFLRTFTALGKTVEDLKVLAILELLREDITPTGNRKYVSKAYKAIELCRESLRAIVNKPQNQYLQTIVNQPTQSQLGEVLNKLEAALPNVYISHINNNPSSGVNDNLGYGELGILNSVPALIFCQGQEVDGEELFDIILVSNEEDPQCIAEANVIREQEGSQPLIGTKVTRYYLLQANLTKETFTIVNGHANVCSIGNGRYSGLINVLSGKSPKDVVPTLERVVVRASYFSNIINSLTTRTHEVSPPPPPSSVRQKASGFGVRTPFVTSEPTEFFRCREIIIDPLGQNQATINNGDYHLPENPMSASQRHGVALHTVKGHERRIFWRNSETGDYILDKDGNPIVKRVVLIPKHQRGDPKLGIVGHVTVIEPSQPNI